MWKNLRFKIIRNPLPSQLGPCTPSVSHFLTLCIFSHSHHLPAFLKSPDFYSFIEKLHYHLIKSYLIARPKSPLPPCNMHKLFIITSMPYEFSYLRISHLTTNYSQSVWASRTLLGPTYTLFTLVLEHITVCPLPLSISFLYSFTAQLLQLVKLDNQVLHP